MKNNISSLIFDFDGVIADTDYARFNILKSILKKKGLNFNFNITALKGLSTKSFLQKNYPVISKNEIDNIIQERHFKYLSNLKKYCIPFEGMKNTLLHLFEYFDLYIVTTNSLEILEIQLEFLKINELFKRKIGRESAENMNLKKTYENIQNIIKKTIKECIVIEDSLIGIEAAKNEGYFCIKFNPYKEQLQGKEDFEVNNYKELEKFLMKYTTRQQKI